MRAKRRGAAGTGWRPGGLACDEVRRRIWRLAGRDLKPRTRRAMLAHLKACDHCFARVEFAAMLRILNRDTFTAGAGPRGLAARIHGRLG